MCVRGADKSNFTFISITAFYHTSLYKTDRQTILLCGGWQVTPSVRVWKHNMQMFAIRSLCVLESTANSSIRWQHGTVGIRATFAANRDTEQYASMAVLLWCDCLDKAASLSGHSERMSQRNMTGHDAVICSSYRTYLNIQSGTACSFK